MRQGRESLNFYGTFHTQSQTNVLYISTITIKMKNKIYNNIFK